MVKVPPFAPLVPLVVVFWRLAAIVRRFEAAGAVTDTTAVRLEQIRLRRSPILRRLARAGVLRTNDDECFYLDRDRYREWIAVRRKRVIVAALFAAALVTAVLLWGP